MQSIGEHNEQYIATIDTVEIIDLLFVGYPGPKVEHQNVPDVRARKNTGAREFLSQRERTRLNK